jgi:hypothetical protein
MPKERVGNARDPALTTAPVWGRYDGGAALKATFCRVAPFLFSQIYRPHVVSLRAV